MRIGYTVKGKKALEYYETPKDCLLYMINASGETLIGHFESRDKAERFSEAHDYRGTSWRIEDIRI